jgi:tetratricopeptide (TPR) repeat protein
LDERIENARTLVDLAVGIGDRSAAHFGYLAGAIAHLERGQMGRAGFAWNGAVAAAGSAPGINETGSISLYRASHAFAEGRLGQAQALLQETSLADTDAPCALEAILWVFLRREQSAFSAAAATARQMAEQSPEIEIYTALRALLELDLGREREARFDFERLFCDQKRWLPRDAMFLTRGALMAELCAELGDAKRAAELYSMLIPYGSYFAVMGHGLVLGPVSMYLGILATTLGQLGLSRQHLEDALWLNRRAGLRTWNAYAHYYLGRCLLAGENSSMKADANRFIQEAKAEAETLGLARLIKKVQPLVCGALMSGTELSRESKPENDNPVSPDVGDIMIAPTGYGNTLQFREEGDTCLFAFRGENVRVRMSKGLKLILTLLGAPGQDFHVLDLERIGNGNGDASECGRAADGEPQLDAAAKRSYRTRLQHLREQLEEAQQFNDSHRASMIDEEIGFLARELARAVGLRGSDRKAFSDAERSRARATQAIRAAIRNIAKHDTVLGWYLGKAVRTGSFCCYRPAPAKTRLMGNKTSKLRM